MRRPKERGKLTLIELGIFTVCLVFLTLCLQWGYQRYGGWRGVVRALLTLLVILTLAGGALGFLGSWIFTGMSYPACRSCRTSNYRQGRLDNGQYVLFCCGCGMPYRRRGRRFHEVQPDGSVRPYMIWKAFRGWFPDA